MGYSKFKSFLSLQLGYSDLLSDKEVPNDFSYSIDTSADITSQQRLPLRYFYFKNENELFQKHLALWNQNDCSSFIAVFDNKTFIIDSRQKPDNETHLPKRIIIKTFEYGVNTESYDIRKELYLISKEGVDSSAYFRFVIEHQKRKKSSEVDKELLLNLLALRKDLSSTPNEQVDLLLLRCMFIKYLEDRGVFPKDTLFKALNSGSSEQLIRTFAKVRKINGDLFSRKELSANDIHPSYLGKLSIFFGYTDYQKKQIKFFPYQFDKIPIQLISHIYESFLNEETRRGGGIYYTPSFLVDFMLSQTLRLKLQDNLQTTVLDPACGSGIFLVSAFRMIIKANKAERDYDKKKKILQHQLFGIDLDERALQIAAFSLYLALLEGEDPEFIQDKIEKEAPILPDLISKNLIYSNALTQDVVFALPENKTIQTFDCIAANPPWGSVPENGNEENIKTRDAIGNIAKSGIIAAYKNVSDYQRSQAFLLRTAKWSHKGTVASMVVNNSIFFNENGEGFRNDFLSNYRLNKFYELSDVNPILFKKRSIGKIKSNNVEIGANEPCCVLIYETEKDDNGKLQYISPKLNDFSKYLQLISYSSKDVVEVTKTDLLQEDLLWKIFVSGSWSEYQIIKKRILEKDNRIVIECRVGFQPKQNMKRLGQPNYRTLIEPSNFNRYGLINKKLERFDWNQKLRRRPDESIFSGQRILVPVRPLNSDELRFRAVKVNQPYVHKHNILCVKILKDGIYAKDYRPFLAILNSKYLGFLFYHISSQWGKGDAKRSTLRNSDIEALPFPSFEFSDAKIKQLSKLVDNIERAKSLNKDATRIENDIDELVFDLYRLTEYERTVVNEFYEIFYRRNNSRVCTTDLDHYSNRFSDVFRLMLSNDYELTFMHNVSSNLGAVVSFTIRNKGSKYKEDKSSMLDIGSIVKKCQTERSYVSSVLAEEKVKYYDKTQQRFYIIKSNQFRDWTERQAIDDANEEIGQIVTFLKGK
jgi:hypothetical protein